MMENKEIINILLLYKKNKYIFIIKEKKNKKKIS